MNRILKFRSVVSRKLLMTLFVLIFTVLPLTSCSLYSSETIPGPDKSATGTVLGALTGAGAGAITGTQVAAATGPGAWIGAGFGAVYGLLQGLGLDIIEEDELAKEAEIAKLREKAWAQGILTEHYQRRVAMHPDRDIFPADLFFSEDKSNLKPEAYALVSEIAGMQKNRKPWSRILVAVYNRAPESSEYSNFLSNKRARSVAQQMIRSGLEPRRILCKGVAIDAPVLIDPEDKHDRYSQAVEIIALD